MVLNMVVSEAAVDRQGQSALLDKITEILFIQAIRAYTDQQQSDHSFLAALQDRHVVSALTVMHQSPEKSWTLETLAREAGMSRSVFANRFHELVGITPMKYLMVQRMEMARQKIQETQLSLPVIAEQVGYSSDSAFKKAFKKFYERTPSSFRKEGGS